MKSVILLYKQDQKRVQNVYQNIVPKLQNVKIISAIDGKTNELEYNLGNREINTKFLSFCRRGQLACLLSHIKIWKYMINENIEELLVLEDDSVISDDFIDKLLLVKNELSENYDFCYLYVHPDSKQIVVNDNKYIDQGYKTYGTVGYLIKLNTAKELVDVFKNKITTTVDDTISWYLDYYKKRYFNVKENIVETSGKLYFHRNTNENLGSIIGETDLYKNSNPNPTFYIDSGDYLYFPNVDSLEGDCLYKYDFDINEGKEEFLKNQDVVAFNTGGWIKDKLNPQNEWVVFQNCHEEFGLYIKKSKYFTENKSVLLTGGCGFIGSHCVLELLKLNYEIVIVDNLSNSSIQSIDHIKDTAILYGYLNPKIYFYNIDITNKEKLNKVFINHSNIESVIHLAAYKSVGESVSNPLKYFQNNIVGLLNILENIKKYKLNKLVFSSSATVYGIPEKLPLTEDSKLNILNPYGTTKLHCEQILQDFCKSEPNIKVISLRYFNPVGNDKFGLIGENPKGIPTNLFPIILSVMNGKREYLEIFGNDYNTKDGTASRDYIHVSDLANGHVCALNYIDNMKDTNYDVFNLGTGHGYTVLEILNNFSKLIKKEIPDKIPHKISHKFVDRRKGDSPEVYADSSKAEKILGWKSKYNLNEMILDCLKFQKFVKIVDL